MSVQQMLHFFFLLLFTFCKVVQYKEKHVFDRQQQSHMKILYVSVTKSDDVLVLCDSTTEPESLQILYDPTTEPNLLYY
jgi:hypothetical protein